MHHDDESRKIGSAVRSTMVGAGENLVFVKIEHGFGLSLDTSDLAIASSASSIRQDLVASAREPSTSVDQE